jgi:hypothetical protein
MVLFRLSKVISRKKEPVPDGEVLTVRTFIKRIELDEPKVQDMLTYFEDRFESYIGENDFYIPISELIETAQEAKKEAEADEEDPDDSILFALTLEPYTGYFFALDYDEGEFMEANHV